MLDNETGLLVPPADPKQLAVALRRVVDDPARGRSLAESGWRRARDEFSIDMMTEQYLALYREICERRKGTARRGLR